MIQGLLQFSDNIKIFPFLFFCKKTSHITKMSFISDE